MCGKGRPSARDRDLAVINIMCVFVVRGDRVLELMMCGRGDLLLVPINLRMCWEEETECLYSLILYVCVLEGETEYLHSSMCSKGRPSACTHYYACVCGKILRAVNNYY